MNDIKYKYIILLKNNNNKLIEIDKLNKMLFNNSSGLEFKLTTLLIKTNLNEYKSLILNDKEKNTFNLEEIKNYSKLIFQDALDNIQNYNIDNYNLIIFKIFKEENFSLFFNPNKFLETKILVY